MEKKKTKVNNGIKFTIVAVVLIALFCVAVSPVTLQNDTYYTIKIGEHIQNNGIDMKDPFSWHEDLNYTYPHWLYDLLTFKIYEAFGFMGIYVVTCILSVILGILIYFVSVKLTKNNWVPFFVTIGAMYLLEGYIAARAQLVTFILFILTIFFIEKFLENRKIRYGVGIVLIATLIANLHVAVWPFMFILFLPYIGEYAISAFSDFTIYRRIEEIKLKRKIKHCKDLSKKEKLEKELKELENKVEKIKIERKKNLDNPYKIRMVRNNNAKFLILIMVICIFTGFLTPLGDTPYTYLLKTYSGNTPAHINEHLPMTIAEQPEVLCTVVLILSILTFTKTKIQLADLFMIGGLALLMLMARRQLSMFTLMGALIFSKMLVELLNIYAKELFIILMKDSGTILTIILTCMIVFTLSYDKVKDKFDDTFVDESSYPVQACDYILDNIDLKTARFYNEYNYGSYMLFRGIPVFIDSRADLYAPEFSGLKEDIFMDFINVSSIGDFYEDIFEKYNITHALMPADTKIAMIIDKTKDSNYKKIYSDDYFVIYERLNAKKGDKVVDFSNETESVVTNQ